MSAIAFRPHHFLCTLCFQGKGYSPQFVRNYKNIVQQLRDDQGDNISIHVVAHTDSICAPCPNKRDEQCKTQAKIEQLDHNHAKALSLKINETITWNEAKSRIKSLMTLEIFEKICAPCEWKKFGWCEKTLREFCNISKDK